MERQQSPARAPARFFEDYRPGATEEFGSASVDAEEIVSFARRFDPQLFHLDVEAARRSSFGGLVASGWHTAAMVMRVMVDHLLSPASSLGSPGVDELRWLLPVRPGDVLSVRATVTEVRPSRRRPDRGTVHARVEVLNQDHRTVMTMNAMFLVRRRDTQESADGPEVPSASFSTGT
jgi:acyl dehydratase